MKETSLRQMQELSSLKYAIVKDSGMINYDDSVQSSLRHRLNPNNSVSVFLRLLQFISQNRSTETHVICLYTPMNIVDAASDYFPDMEFLAYTYKSEVSNSKRVTVMNTDKEQVLSRPTIKKDIVNAGAEKFMLFSTYTGKPGDEKDPKTIDSVNKQNMKWINSLAMVYSSFKCTYRFKLQYESVAVESEAPKGVYYWPAYAPITSNVTFVEPKFITSDNKTTLEKDLIINNEYDRLCAHQNQIVRGTHKYDVPKVISGRVTNDFDAALQVLIISQYLGNITSDANIKSISRDINKRFATI